MWIYVYKFDKHGRLLKCKARLVVRRDQQAKAELDTYAATLAAQSFRIEETRLNTLCPGKLLCKPLVA